MANASITRSEALARLDRHGISGALIYLLDALPLVEMAWSDGVVQPSERAVILSFLDAHLARLDEQAQHTVVRREDALDFINRFLAQPPDSQTFAELRELLVVVRLTGERGPVRAQRILDAVTEVGAVASSPGKPDQRWDKRELLTMWGLQESLLPH